jgi:hypothetical protein
MIDLITVVFRDELEVLRLQAQSVERYGQNLGTIYVVVNDADTVADQIDPDWWGARSGQVQIVCRSRWPVDYDQNGWLTQQLLKLLATDLCTNSWSMILDAKTLFVEPITIDEKPQVGELDIYPVFKTSQQIVSELFDIDLKKQLGPGGVPFIVNNALVQDLIADVVAKTNQSFSEWFQRQGMVTEFILYSGYVVYRFGSFDAVYDSKHSTLHPCNICHSEVASFDRKFKEMQTANTVSIHRRAWAQLSPQQRSQYLEFLSSRGIK